MLWKICHTMDAVIQGMRPKLKTETTVWRPAISSLKYCCIPPPPSAFSGVTTHGMGTFCPNTYMMRISMEYSNLSRKIDFVIILCFYFALHTVLLLYYAFAQRILYTLLPLSKISLTVLLFYSIFPIIYFACHGPRM